MNMTTQNRTRIIVDVTPEFHKAVRQAALDQDKTIKEVVLSCLQRCLSETKDAERLAAPSQPPREG